MGVVDWHSARSDLAGVSGSGVNFLKPWLLVEGEMGARLFWQFYSRAPAHGGWGWSRPGSEEVAKIGEGTEWVSYFASLKACADKKRGVHSPRLLMHGRTQKGGPC